ncbi:unnamed protein product, partial [Symbiodinium microadriaticum]
CEVLQIIALLRSDARPSKVDAASRAPLGADVAVYDTGNVFFPGHKQRQRGEEAARCCNINESSQCEGEIIWWRGSPGTASSAETDEESGALLPTPFGEILRGPSLWGKWEVAKLQSKGPGGTVRRSANQGGASELLEATMNRGDFRLRDKSGRINSELRRKLPGKTEHLRVWNQRASTLQQKGSSERLRFLPRLLRCATAKVFKSTHHRVRLRSDGCTGRVFYVCRSGFGKRGEENIVSLR